ncbi:MAG TPA: HAMP domain-containing histidine kinase, partial [Candidatus Pelethocola excrementipullorum]|nr:HAMP domain-containing histidine kinase [Candidatus Pelethocola excrementipullorum]
WLALITFLCLVAVHSVYGQVDYMYSQSILNKFNRFVLIGNAIGTIVGGILIFGSYRYLKKYPLKNHLQPTRLDSWKLEWVLIPMAVIAVLWYRGVHVTEYRPEVWESYIVNSVAKVFRYLITMLLLNGLLYAGTIMLVRKKVLGKWKDTSIVYGEIQRYKMRTPLEKRIADNSKVLLMVFGVLVAVNLAYMVLRMGRSGISIFFSAALTLAGFVLFLIYFFRNNIQNDTGKLLQQIHHMAEGEDIPDSAALEEKSLLYQASCELSNIESVMKKSVEKQVQAERMKIDLVTNVSHDLKTPLTSMVGYTDLLKKEPLSEEAMDYVDVISAKQEQLKDMIQDLFELSKATSNSDQLVIETLDMKKLLEQILADMGDAITQSDLIFRKVFSEEPLLFPGDNSKMYRVVQNLLENALKYSMSGTRIYVEARKVKEKVQLIIKNISAYEMDFTPDEVVERFNRGDKSRSTEGHGLGLAIASSFAQNMGGKMSVDIDGDLFKVILSFPAAGQSLTAEEEMKDEY